MFLKALLLIQVFSFFIIYLSSRILVTYPLLGEAIGINRVTELVGQA